MQYTKMGFRALGSLFPALCRTGGRSAGAGWSQPLLWEGAVRRSSTLGAQALEPEKAADAEESWWQDVQAAATDGGERQPAPVRGRQPDALDAPIDTPRTLRDYQKMVLALTRRKRAYLIRDLLEEMSLNGVRPDKYILSTGLFACMKSRKLADAMYFFEEMQRRGTPPDGFQYSNAISACGRGGQLARMEELRDDMLRRGLEMTHNTRLALLNAYSEAGKMQATRAMFDEIVQSGHPADEFAYAGLINCYRHLPPRLVPEDVEQQMLGLRSRFDAAAREASEAAQAGGASRDEQEESSWEGGGGGGGSARAEGRGGYHPRLVVANAVLNSLAELGRHEAAVALYRGLKDEGLQPNHTTFSNVIRSYMRQALGKHRQPGGEALTTIITERLKEEDLQPYIEAVLAEDAALAADVAAAQSAHAAREGEQQGSGGEPAAAALDAADAVDAALVAGLAEVEVEPGVAALRTLGREPPAGVDTAGEESVADLAAVPGGPQEQPAQRQQRGWQPWKVRSVEQLERVVREQAVKRARSKLRFDVFRQHLDVDAWYEALHLFQEVLDRGLLWGPDITYAMVKAALDMQAAGIEHSMDVGHTVMDTFNRQGLFVDVEHGTEVLLLAVRRDVADLSLAHRIYDNMRKSHRVPKTPTMYKYMRAMVLRDPGAADRLIDVCTQICSDPDKAPDVMAMKRDAYQRRQHLLAGMTPEQAQAAQQSARRQQRQQQSRPRYARGQR